MNWCSTTSPPVRRDARWTRDWIGRVAEVLDIPFCVAGGIRSVADAEAVLNGGAEKISVNSPALQRPQLIDGLARALWLAMRRGRHRQPDHRRRVVASTSSPEIRTAAGFRARHACLGA